MRRIMVAVIVALVLAAGSAFGVDITSFNMVYPNRLWTTTASQEPEPTWTSAPRLRTTPCSYL